MTSVRSVPTCEPGTVAVGDDVVTGYRVIELLSHGNRVDTYDVHSTQRDCRCVVKIVRADRFGVARVREAVLAEGRLLRDLTHPHLVRAYEVIEHPVPAVVLETLGGRTLDAVVDDHPLAIADSALLGLQLASALGYLHRNGWLHLDVKPDNVIVEGGRAVLIDLSVAARPGQGRPGAGTPGYLAPEQETGAGLSPATDVWGLGVTLAECLTQELPGTAPWSRRGLRRRRRIPDAYAALLDRCLDPVAARRPALHQVRDVLAHVAGSH